ncbi:MAG: SOS response-associated peptidase [Bacteroidia bacterium]|nr:SOS response-associated peptidase [Bacteroidia bacterium]
MCYHASVATTYQNLEDQYQKPFDGDLFPSFTSKNDVVAYHLNGFSFPKMPVITMQESNTIKLYNWGLIPAWVTDKQQADEIKINTLNAKSETAFDKPSFKQSIINQRCIIPVTGFFEWQTQGPKNKIPHFIHLPNKPIFSLAGIYSSWLNPNNQDVYHTFSILTCEANSLMQKIHNSKKRMPCILSTEQEKIWLDPTLVQAEIMEVMSAYEDTEMEAYAISNLIHNKSGNSNTPAVINPAPKPFGDLFS